MSRTLHIYSAGNRIIQRSILEIFKLKKSTHWSLGSRNLRDTAKTENKSLL
jgi:hypothetical protein